MYTGIDAEKKTKAIIILSVLTVLWMAVIFLFSSQPAEQSAQLSGVISTAISNLSKSIYGNNPPSFVDFIINNGEHFVRKTGHIAEYFLLGALVMMLVKRLDFMRFWNSLPASRTYILVSLLICILYASSDEIHQIFVPGRGPLVTDVLLDSCAAFLGILLARRTGSHDKVSAT